MATDEYGKVRKTPWGNPLILDQNKCPIPTALDIQERQIEEARIRREKAEHWRGGPVAGHDFRREREEEERGYSR